MRRILPAVVLAIGFTLGAAACLPPPEPLQNGRFPDSALETIDANCQVAKDVAAPLRALISAALADGLVVRPESQSYIGTIPGPPRMTSCYRDYDMQVWWRGFYCFWSSCGFAAVPGTSIHGWGRAVDFEDGAGKLTFASAGYQWLQAHAATYGFVHPAWAEPGGSSPEPWHWEHG